MKLAIMQPYFMPYIGYFQLINNVDEFIVFDTPQFIRHGWIERNRILKPNGEFLYVKVPLVKHSRQTSIQEIKIKNSENWKEKILAQLIPYKKKAKNYYDVIQLVKNIFELETDSIVELNAYALKIICNYLDIKTPIRIWSEMNLEIENINAPDEWALQICKSLKATSYINPEGGITFFDTEKYKREQIEIKFLVSNSIVYKQFDNNFMPNLSILDVMMFCNSNDIKRMLKSFKLIDK